LKLFMFMGIAAATNYSRRILQKKKGFNIVVSYMFISNEMLHRGPDK
jgi:hypothetical protein